MPQVCFENIEKIRDVEFYFWHIEENCDEFSELIADNDSESIGEGYYREIAERPYRWRSEVGGFAQLLDIYPSGHNPFTDGTVRYVATTDELGGTATATWGGAIAKSGLYTLYVSYKSLRRSVRDARYRVYASGGVHEIEVNQRMR